jgi:hypothetical protein
MIDIKIASQPARLGCWEAINVAFLFNGIVGHRDTDSSLDVSEAAIP